MKEKSNKKKKTLALIVILLVVIATAVLLIYIIKNDNSEEPKNLEKDRVAEKAVVDGDVSNVEKTLLAQHLFRNYRIKAIRLANQGPYYVFSFTVDNISDVDLKEQNFDVTFLSSAGRVLGSVEVSIPALAKNASDKAYTYTSQKSVFNAFDFRLSDVNEKKLIPDKAKTSK